MKVFFALLLATIVLATVVDVACSKPRGTTDFAGIIIDSNIKVFCLF